MIYKYNWFKCLKWRGRVITRVNAWPQMEKGRWLGWPSWRLEYFTWAFNSWHFQGEGKFWIELKAYAKVQRSKRMEQAWKISGSKGDLHAGCASVSFVEVSEHRHSARHYLWRWGSGRFYSLKVLPVFLMCSQDWDLPERPFGGMQVWLQMLCGGAETLFYM